MITRIRIGNGRPIEIDGNKKSLTREQQVEELKNFITRPKLFAAQHKGA